MVIVKDECVGCPPEIGCYGSSCPYKNVPHYFCDECGEEITDNFDKISIGDLDYHTNCVNKE